MDWFFALEQDLPPGAGFRLWGPGHLGMLALCGLAAAALGLGYCRLDPAGRGRLRRGLGLAVLLCEAAKDANLIAQGVMGVYFLPLHLCGLAVFFTFWHSLLRPEGELGRTLGNFLYSTCMPGAAFALLFPDWTAYPLLGFHSLVAFLVHTLLVAYPLVQVAAGDLRPEPGLLGRCLALLAGLAGAVYLFDRTFEANYMFLLEPAPGSPLEWFAGAFGNPGYLLGYVPMLALVWLLLYLPFRHKKIPPP